MKTIFDSSTRNELIERITSINENSKALWGKMNVYEMLQHCTLWEDMMQGRTKYKRAFMGRIFGKMALKSILKDDSPLRRSTPTISELKISGQGNLSEQKREWIERIKAYENFSNPDFVHVFFGKMTKEQIGYMVYKHGDHHLRQFSG